MSSSSSKHRVKKKTKRATSDKKLSINNVNLFDIVVDFNPTKVMRLTAVLFPRLLSHL